MFKNTLILIILLLGLTVSTTLAQSTAQATMNVSVEVVEGASVRVNQPDKVNVSQKDIFKLGVVSLKGMSQKKTLINVSDLITLSGSNGNKLDLLIRAEIESTTDANNIRYKALSMNRAIQQGTYSGELATTVEYL